jgi:hypothetical protein
VIQKLIQKLRSRGLVPAALVTCVLAAAIFAAPVAGMIRFVLPAYCTAVSLSAAPASPSNVGTSITVTATSTCANASPKYQFLALWAGTSSWVVQQSFSTTTTWTWNSTGAPAGTERFGVWAKDANSPNVYDVVASIPYSITNAACTALSATAAPGSPSKAGTSITVTATSTCPDAGQKYQFLALWAGTSAWIVQQSYSTTATWTWNSTGANGGVERFGVWVKDAASTNTADMYFSLPYTVTNTPCTVLSLTAAPASPQAHGTSITVTATSTCPDAGQKYQFLALWATTSSYVVEQAYSTTTTWTWNSTGAPAGVERFGVWVKDASSAASSQADLYFSIAFTIT